MDTAVGLGQVPVINKDNPDLRDDIPETAWVELQKDNKAYFFNHEVKLYLILYH